MSPPSPTGLPWFRRFRTRLIVVIFPILAAATGASLWIAERRFSQLYQEVFDTQFQSYIDSFSQSRANRFDAIRSKLDDLVAHPSLIASLKSGDAQLVRPLLDSTLLDLGRQRLSSESVPFDPGRRPPPRLSPSRLAPPRAIPPGDGSLPPSTGPGLDRRRDSPRTSSDSPPSSQPPPLFFALLDASGHPVHGSIFPNRALNPDRNRETRAFLHLQDHALGEMLPHQQVGYKLLDIPGESLRQVREIFITPVSDADGTFLGALVFGLPLPTLDERVLFQQTRRMEQGQILSGVWVEGEIVSSTIPQARQPDLARLISSALEGKSGSSGDLEVSVDDRRYRVIYRALNPDSPFEKAVQINLYSLATVDAEIARLRLLSAEIGGLAMLVSLGLIILVSRKLSGPVSSLTTATRQIAAGNYSFRVPVRSKDEIGLLSRAFNDMAADLALKDRYRSILSAVADPAVARRLIHDSHDLGGAQKTVSMLFCDIRGFTSLSEQLPPASVITLLNEHMTELTDVAYQYGGTVDKFVGDMIMVLFGAPESQPDDALRAVRCALAMRAARARLNQHSPHPLEIGIGIATGTVVAGCMGSQKRLDYTVLGHRVNLASRLCDVASAGQILIDDATRSHLPGGASIDALPQARLKGISSEVRAYAVLALPDAHAPA